MVCLRLHILSRFLRGQASFVKFIPSDFNHLILYFQAIENRPENQAMRLNLPSPRRFQGIRKMVPVVVLG